MKRDSAPKLPAYTTTAAMTPAIWLRSTAPRPSPKTPQATNPTRLSSTERSTPHPVSDVLTCWLYRNSGVATAAREGATSQNSAPQQAAAATLAVMTVVRRGTVTNVTAAVWFANSLVTISTPRSNANRTPTRCPEVIMLAAIAATPAGEWACA